MQHSMTEVVTSKPSLISAYFNRRVGVLAALGFSCGLPLALSGDVLQQWLLSAKVDLKDIGWLTLVALPYRLKFLWAPAMDRLTPPFLGRRRGWLVITQLAVIAAIVGLSLCDPARNLSWIAIAAIAVAFTSASQDIVADAYRADVLPTDERGPGASLFVTGYRVAMLASGAGILVLVGRGIASWQTALQLTAAVMAVGLIATMLAEKPPAVEKPADHHSVGWAEAFYAAVMLPLADFLGRHRGWLILLFVLLFRLPDQVAAAVTGPFLVKKVGFTPDAIGAVRNGLGMFATIAGALLGGGMITRLGLRRSLWTFAVLQALSNAGFLVLAKAGASYPVFVGVILVENFAGGLVTAGFFVFLMNQCRAEFSATQYALLSSLFAIPSMIAGVYGLQVVERLGYPEYFAISIAFALPGVLMLPFVPTTLARAR
jgi:PAT family beta-lactamase induction signal transducer AmpG